MRPDPSRHVMQTRVTGRFISQPARIPRTPGMCVLMEAVAA